MKPSVVIPAYNEINTIGEILSRVLEVDIPKEVIVVDDCSTDGTREFLREWGAIGILGWFLNSRIFRRKGLSSFQLRVYNLFVPLFKLERFFPLPFGISLLAVGEKSE